MGWFKKLTGLKTPKAIRKIDDDVRKGLKKVDQKLNISENKSTWIGAATFGTYGAITGNQFDKAREKEAKAKEAAKRATEAQRAARRTVMFRSLMQAGEENQQSVADLMNMAAGGGILDSSGVQASLASAKSQRLAEDEYQETLELYGVSEENALYRQSQEEKKYARAQQRGDFLVQTGLNIGLKAVGL